jgi:hypothetical protein
LSQQKQKQNTKRAASMADMVETLDSISSDQNKQQLLAKNYIAHTWRITFIVENYYSFS